MKVTAAPMTMLLPADPGPAGVVTTQAVTTPTSIAPGDRIGMVFISGASTLHALTANASTVLGHGIYPAPPPTAEPGFNSTYDFISNNDNGPLIRGTVSATPGGGAASTKPLASPTKTTFKNVTRTLNVATQCSGLGLQTRCTGTATIEFTFVTGFARAAAGVLGSASYSIPKGTTQNVSIPLSKTARKKLTKKGKLSAFLVIREQDSGKTLTSGTKITIKGKEAKPK
jgi:hypothetical protein